MGKDNNKPSGGKPAPGSKPGSKPKANPALISYIGKEAPKKNVGKRNK